MCLAKQVEHILSFFFHPYKQHVSDQGGVDPDSTLEKIPDPTYLDGWIRIRFNSYRIRNLAVKGNKVTFDHGLFCT